MNLNYSIGNLKQCDCVYTPCEHANDIKAFIIDENGEQIPVKVTGYSMTIEKGHPIKEDFDYVIDESAIKEKEKIMKQLLEKADLEASAVNIQDLTYYLTVLKANEEYRKNWIPPRAGGE